MAAKAKKKTVAKKTATTVIKNTNTKPSSAPLSLAAFTKGFPQFQPFKMETPTMMNNNKQFEKIAQDAAVLGQDQVDAMMKCSTIFAKGLEDIMKTCMEIAQEVGEKSQSAAKTVMACKTLNEFTDIQTKLAQASFDEFMTNATRISEKAVKVCTDAFEPINDQMGKTIKRATDTMAA